MKLTIIFEQGDGEIWGRLKEERYTLLSNDYTTEGVKENIKNLLAKEFGITNPTFRTVWDMSETFENAKALKIEAIANEAKINPSLMRQYAAGLKFVSSKRYEKIVAAIQRIGQELLKIKVL
jgi:hypothetical protein